MSVGGLSIIDSCIWKLLGSDNNSVDLKEISIVYGSEYLQRASDFDLGV